MKKAFLLSMIFLICVSSHLAPKGNEHAGKGGYDISYLNIPGVDDEMLDAGYWIKRYPEADKVILYIDEIKEFNRHAVDKMENMVDLEAYKSELSREELIGYMEQYKIPAQPMLDASGKPIEEAFYHKIKENRNYEGLGERNEVRFGLTVRKTSLRSFPTEHGVYNSAKKLQLDRFQETGVLACEPIAILHRSKDGYWLFIQIYNYRGWAKAEDIAFGKDKKQILDYIKKSDFLIVTGNYVFAQKDPENSAKAENRLGMGTRIPLASSARLNRDAYAVNFPLRDDEGALKFGVQFIGKDQDVSLGYLPYTVGNLIKQALKLRGDPYDWGEKYDGRDCSGYVMLVYRSFGFRLARNASQQENMPGKSYCFEPSDSLKKRELVLDHFKPGAVLFMPGHVMLYLGKSGDTHYMIHDFLAYGEKTDSGYRSVPVYGVEITPVILPSSSGTPFILNFTSALEIR